MADVIATSMLLLLLLYKDDLRNRDLLLVLVFLFGRRTTLWSFTRTQTIGSHETFWLLFRLSITIWLLPTNTGIVLCEFWFFFLFCSFSFCSFAARGHARD